MRFNQWISQSVEHSKLSEINAVHERALFGVSLRFTAKGNREACAAHVVRTIST